MGQTIIEVARDLPDVDIAGALELRSDGTLTGVDRFEGLPVLNRPPKDKEGQLVVVDFSQAGGVTPLVTSLRGSGLPLVSGTTGLDASERDLLKLYSEEHAVFYSENMSYGICLIKALVRDAAVAAGETADVEIVERHHRGKVDVPSGTAISLAKVVSDARYGEGQRPPGPASATEHGVSIHSQRVGGVPGDHDVTFAWDEETVTIAHRALSRAVFARGAIRAARFVQSMGPGLYTMDDLLRNKDA
jgi:4-hydroxy-tetrahydrodipicolinate reductase